MIAHGNGAEHVAIGASAILVIAAYAVLWSRQQEKTPHRLAFWICGVMTLIVASTPWLESLAEETFTGHMVQHLLVIALAAPLLVLAEPLRTAVRSGAIPPTAAGRRLGAAWRRYGALVGPVVFVLVLFVTHLTSVYDRALGNRPIHELEHASYLGGSVLLWSAVMGQGRAASVARVGVAFGVGAAGSVLGIALLSASDPLIPTYERQLGFDDALADQRTAATIMWIGGMVTTVPLLLVAVWRWASAEERTTRRAETLAAHPHAAPTAATQCATRCSEHLPSLPTSSPAGTNGDTVGISDDDTAAASPAATRRTSATRRPSRSQIGANVDPHAAGGHAAHGGERCRPVVGRQPDGGGRPYPGGYQRGNEGKGA